MSEPDLSEFEEEGGVGGDQPCMVGRLMEELNEDRRASLQVALTKKALRPNARHKWEISSIRISRTLRRWEFPISASTVTAHRCGDCSCPR